MTTNIQMLADRPVGDGSFYKKGTVYSVIDDLANYYIAIGAARRVSVKTENGQVATLGKSGKGYEVGDPVTAVTDLNGGISFPAGNSVVPVLGSAIIRLGDLTAVRKAYAGWQTGSPFTMLRIGDSTTVGVGSGTATTWTSAAQRNCSSQFAALTSGEVSADGFMGDAGAGSSPGYSVYNPGVTLGNGWTNNTATLGGTLFKFSVGGTGTLRMALPTGASKVRIYPVGGGGTATIQTNTGVIGALAIGSGTSVVGQTFDVPAGSTYVEVSAPSTTLYIAGIHAFSDLTKAILVNAGINGSLIASHIASAAQYDSLNVIKSIAPKLAVINLTINDANAPTAKATYQSSLATLVEAAMLSGSVALELGAVSNVAASTNGSLYDIRAAVMDIAEAYNLTVMSVPASIGGGFSAANAAGNMFDTWHPTYAGYGLEAQKCWLPVWNVIKN